MSSYKNLLLAVLGLSTIGLSALAWKQHLELVELRADALTNGSRAEWQKRALAAQRRAKDPDRQTAGTPRGGSAAVSLPAPGPAPVARGGMAPSFTSLMDRPEMAHLMAIQQKGQIDARFAALFKNLGLPADKLAQFKALLADKLSAPTDVLAAAGPQGVDPVRNPQEFTKLIQDTQSELDDKIKSLLPPGDYAQYQNYLQTEPQRAVVSQLQQALSYSDTQITPAQADQLVQILADTAATKGVATSTGPGGNVGFATGPFPSSAMGPGAWNATPITDEAIARAQSVLSAPQIQALQDIQQQQQAAAQLRQLLHAERRPAQHRTVPGTGGRRRPPPCTRNPAPAAGFGLPSAGPVRETDMTWRGDPHALARLARREIPTPRPPDEKPRRRLRGPAPA